MPKRLVHPRQLSDPSTVTARPTGQLSEGELLTLGTLLQRGIPLADIADLIGRDPHALRRHCETARQLLELSAIDAAQDWARASAIAASKGDHRPARDLLLAAKVVEPQVSTGAPGVTVSIGFHLPGIPQPASQPSQVIDVTPPVKALTPPK